MKAENYGPEGRIWFGLCFFGGRNGGENKLPKTKQRDRKNARCYNGDVEVPTVGVFNIFEK